MTEQKTAHDLLEELKDWVFVVNDDMATRDHMVDKIDTIKKLLK
jgi:hypothetical protein